MTTMTNQKAKVLTVDEGFINTSVNPELVITYSNSTKLLLREAE